MAKNLQQYIDVDIYGNCGPLKCSEEDWECYEMLNDYRFYFSFENSLCKDYVTEKLFGVMKWVEQEAQLDSFCTFSHIFKCDILIERFITHWPVNVQ